MVPIRVLIADDESDHLELLKLACEAGPVAMAATAVSTFSDLEAALRTGRFDALVLDYNLKPWLATELLDRLAELIGDMPVLVISGSEEQAVVIDSLRSGVADFIPKREAVIGTLLVARLNEALASACERRAEKARKARRERALIRLAETDQLTGLANRRGFDRLASSAMWCRRVKSPVTVALLDIDHFKRVNDTFGHPVGDQVLREVAACLRGVLGPGEAAFRWGGEEFLLVLPTCPQAEGIERLNRLRFAIGSRVKLPDGTGVAVSIGATEARSGDRANTVLEDADGALYRAKNTGRNRVCVAQIAAQTAHSAPLLMAA